MEMTFETIKRRSLIIYMRNLRQVRQLRRYGNVEYVSRRMRYVVLYMDDEQLLETQQKIEQLGFVLRTEIAHRPELNPNLITENEDRGFSLDGDEMIDIVSEGVEV